MGGGSKSKGRHAKGGKGGGSKSCTKGKGKKTNAPRDSEEMQEGDWICVSCGDLQFKHNRCCRHCGALPAHLKELPEQLSLEDAAAEFGREAKPGDWLCTCCGLHNFARNFTCRRCSTPKFARLCITNGDDGPQRTLMRCDMDADADSVIANEHEFSIGDWWCPQCGDHVFMRNDNCRQCGTVKPSWSSSRARGSSRSNEKEPSGGDWRCPEGGDHVFERTNKCRQCGMSKVMIGRANAERSRVPSTGSKTPPWLDKSEDQQCRVSRPTLPALQESTKSDEICTECGDCMVDPRGNCRTCVAKIGVARERRRVMDKDILIDRGGSSGSSCSSGSTINWKAVEGSDKGEKPPDWSCRDCGELQFGRNTVCRMCSSSMDKPASEVPVSADGPQEPESRDSDWHSRSRIKRRRRNIPEEY